MRTLHLLAQQHDDRLRDLLYFAQRLARDIDQHAVPVVTVHLDAASRIRGIDIHDPTALIDHDPQTWLGQPVATSGAAGPATDRALHDARRVGTATVRHVERHPDGLTQEWLGTLVAQDAGAVVSWSVRESYDGPL